MAARQRGLGHSTPSMTFFLSSGSLDTILQGILLGGLYALFAAGLALVFGIMRLVNLAHGDLIVLGAYLVMYLVGALGINPVLAALFAAPLMFALGWAIQR